MPSILRLRLETTNSYGNEFQTVAVSIHLAQRFTVDFADSIKTVRTRRSVHTEQVRTCRPTENWPGVSTHCMNTGGKDDPLYTRLPGRLQHMEGAVYIHRSDVRVVMFVGDTAQVDHNLCALYSSTDCLEVGEVSRTQDLAFHCRIQISDVRQKERVYPSQSFA
ncbi:hypothetical protein ASF71_19160 [Deinococcus sp. Leaf326]|nr:hypothetical protein ASF71_19160 [Deinococcus sp. Leaf326]